MLTQNYIVREKNKSISNYIPIQHNVNNTFLNTLQPHNEYSLKQNLIDPSKSSPPNDFMIKLHMRMNKFYLDKNDNNFDME